MKKTETPYAPLCIACGQFKATCTCDCADKDRPSEEVRKPELHSGALVRAQRRLQSGKLSEFEDYIYLNGHYYRLAQVTRQPATPSQILENRYFTPKLKQV